MRRLLLLLWTCSAIFAQESTLTLTGTLSRAMAIGGESTGWSIHLDTPASIKGKQLASIEVASSDTEKLRELNGQHVKVTGKLSQRHGVETGMRSVLDISSIEKVEAETAALLGTEWILEDLGGSGVLDDAQATLAFLEPGKVAGRASCNRFSGTAKINGSEIQVGPLVSTRMLCPEALMKQEAQYLKALESADRIERDGSNLMLHSRTFEKPLKFTLKAK